jgi:hypothetical protein
MTDTFHPRCVRLRLATVTFTLVLLGACGGAPAITTCEAGAGLTPDCRYQNPEDLAVSPLGNFLLISQMGGMDGERPGNLVSFEPASGAIRVLYPHAEAHHPVAGWGDAACRPPTVFAPHGIHLERLDNGADALYVINHGGRESVEMFEVLEFGTEIELLWRGCVVAPDHGYFNDLVVLRNGDFWASQMFPRNANLIWTSLRMMFLGHTLGYAYHWSPERGFQALPGTETKFANGIEKSADERTVFLNSYFGGEVIKVDVATGERLGSTPVPAPDNLSWSPTGELLVAGHLGTIRETLACADLPEGSCGFGFQIVAVDPATMVGRLLLEHGGPPMGAVTVAVPFGDSVYLGTFAGDRIAQVDASILAPAERP